MCAVDLFSKYAWVFRLKGIRGITVVNAFQKIISKGGTPNKIWLHQSGEFYNNIFKRFPKINNTEMYSIYSEEKSALGERSNRKLKKRFLNK